MLVVVADVSREDSVEVPSVDDQDPVEALAAYGADPPFDERVGARRVQCRAGERDRVRVSASPRRNAFVAPAAAA